MDLLDELQSRVLCGDGAIGTLLLEQGFPLERCFEVLCLKEPDRIRAIHEQYIGAGARVIKTHTFGANSVRLERFGLVSQVAEINRTAAQIASRTARGKDIYVAGSIGPLGLSGKEAAVRGVDRDLCFREQISALLEGGVDIIFFETFMDIVEMEIAVRARQEVGDGISICSFACPPDGRISPEMQLPDAFAKLRALGASIVGLNCTNGPEAMVQLLERVPGEGLMAAYPNAGVPEYHEGRFVYPGTAEQFAQSARAMVAEGARLVGGCCGTTPAHIAAMAAAISNLQPARV
jgi:methionine synthase / methylenetetrahydrofolate reductase (NADH)